MQVWWMYMWNNNIRPSIYNCFDNKCATFTDTNHVGSKTNMLKEMKSFKSQSSVHKHVFTSSIYKNIIQREKWH